MFYKIPNFHFIGHGHDEDKKKSGESHKKIRTSIPYAKWIISLFYEKNYLSRFDNFDNSFVSEMALAPRDLK